MDDLLAALVPGLAWALLDFVWQGLLIGWGVALALGLMRKSRPQARYALACGALLLCAALPLAGRVQRLADAGSDSAQATTALALVLAGQAGGDAALAAAPPGVAVKLAGWEQALQARLPLVMLFWACGAGALALRMLAGLAWVRRRSRPGQYLEHPQLQATLSRMAQAFGISRPVRLGLVGDMASPVTAGWWRPVVLVPAALASGMPLQLLEALLAHELAHIKRHDYLVNLVQGTIEIVLFYHPTVWWLSNRIRIEREQIADDLAASMLGEPRRLALALSELDQFQFPTPHLAHAAHGGNLMSRIKRLVRPDTEPLNWKMAVPVLGLAAACAAFYANAQSVPAPAPAPSPSVKAAPAPSPTARPAPAPRVKKEWTVSKGHDTPYALVRGPERKGSTMSGSSDDWREIEAVKRAVPGDFFWFRKDGKAYIVQDPAVLARLIEAWEPVDRLGVQMDAHGKEMDVHGKEMERLGKQMEAAGRDIHPDPAEQRKMEKRMKELSREQEKLGREIDRTARKMAEAKGAERDRLTEEMNKLSSQMAEQGRLMEKEGEGMARMGEEMARRHAPMEAIGKQMEQAGKPMEALGEKMGKLGEQMERESAAADKVVRALIADALSRGVAVPAPGRNKEG
jgi:beta-lactamase regulating signal transducer with metallopeptidase domain